MRDGDDEKQPAKAEETDEEERDVEAGEYDLGEGGMRFGEGHPPDEKNVT